MKKVLTAILVAFAMNAQAQTTAVSFHSSNGNYWHMKTESVTDNIGMAQIVINTAAPQQTFKGWGTCFNELDYDAWSLLSETDRTLFTKRVFNPNGDLRLGVGRISVGASDYACDWYSCDETSYDGTNSDGTLNYATDFTMEHFTIERDRQKVIPSIKQALAENPDMTFWASPWSPPQWMKTNKHYAQRVTSTNGCPFGVAPYDNDQFSDVMPNRQMSTRIRNVWSSGTRFRPRSTSHFAVLSISYRWDIIKTLLRDRLSLSVHTRTLVYLEMYFLPPTIYMPLGRLSVDGAILRPSRV